ncbi:MAG: hypothetical protein JWP57_4685 [Spirosoma sp.]|nr:hypothetical protein [Spirosoma sp.]
MTAVAGERQAPCQQSPRHHLKDYESLNACMRYREIIAESGTSTTSTVGDTWQERFADHQRQQEKRAKTRQRIAAAETSAADQARTAAAARAHNHDRIAAAKRDLS